MKDKKSLPEESRTEENQEEIAELESVIDGCFWKVSLIDSLCEAMIAGQEPTCSTGCFHGLKLVTEEIIEGFDKVQSHFRHILWEKQNHETEKESDSQEV